ncbi:phenylalanine--tRNA ligase subunit beta [Aliiglaciecola sp. CAU 1673]|uniref:phenylalanine--tRNA ligase subunit beta n=1 Tax=Aliiglaciecola sp. CAU 1673 TaxID=3032595 RepID=UPI0023D9890E|nr:phenylalanine--tRNA ligase subunit beta [Aliiglaciecola sp. CAU 1673]MDF2177594.1 phenylalanine--tRNA ligase subunit beta [Aliiglaciecola sp. CAU 1673]
MKFSDKWLREWVNPSISPAQLAEQITMAGLEVDAVEPVAPEFSDVLVGHVVECGQHPDADKLRVTKVDVGQGELLDIVCGAPNCRQGLKVAVAVVGAVLPGDFKIKKAKLRGQPSHGMLCSASELGLSEDHDGIIELPFDAPVGQNLRDYLQLDDVSIEVDLTPNRADCLGIKGLAREVGVLNQLTACGPAITESPVTIEAHRDVILDDAAACPRYLGRIIEGINMDAKTPVWMKERLRRCGVRSIDPVVDVTNYVLLELGHPMHAFDNEVLEGAIHVRLAKAGEKLVLLDGDEVTLSDNTLVIADEKKALAMAGIFGGKASGVTEQSRNIFLESAFFAPDFMMGKARQYGLHTDASHRYERGVDPTLQREAMERATALLLEIVGGKAGPIVEAKSDEHLPKAKSLRLRRKRLSRLLGIEVNAEQVTNIFSKMGFEVSDDGQQWSVNVPAYRFDITIEEDLIEEVARVFGYNNVPVVSPTASLKMATHQEQQTPLMLLKQRLVSLGFQEAITYSFVDPKVQQKLFPQYEALVLPHPISVEMSAMRVSLWPGLLQSVSYNQKRQQSQIALFETGLRFVPDSSAEAAVRQESVIGGVLAGLRQSEHWDLPSTAVDFFDAKAAVEALLSSTAQIGSFSFKAMEHSALHPGQSAAILRNGEVMGWVGALHPQFEKTLGLNGRTFVFELLLDALSQRALPQAKEISKFPSNRRDIAIVVQENVEVANILSCIEKFGGNQLVGLNLFDVYRGKGIDPGSKSLAISLTLQDPARTLEEHEIQAVVDKILAALSDEFGASLRD